MKRTIRELAEYLQADCEGDPSLWISGVASPETAGPEDVIYVENKKQLLRAQASAALCAIAGRDVPLRGKTVVRVAEPKLAFAKAARWLMETPPRASGIDPTAVIDPAAKISQGVSVGPYAVIEADVRIGANTEIAALCFIGRGAKLGDSCRLFPRVTLCAGARLGDRVMIHSGAVIGDEGFGYVYAQDEHWKFPQLGGVEIGDDTEIGNNSTIARGSLGTTRIGRGVKIDNLVHVAHNVQIGDLTLIAAQTGISGSCEIGRHVLIGGQAGLGEHCVIEDEAILGGQAGILNGKRVRSKEFVWGTPARPLAEFKKQFAGFAKLPLLAERVRKLERRGGK